MNRRGHKAVLPVEDHARPEYLSADGLVVHHYNRDGHVKVYDFGALPVAEPMQRSLAALFAARCVPARWAAHGTSTSFWLCILRLGEFVATQQHPPRDLPDFTVEFLRRWRRHILAVNGDHTMRATVDLLREDPRLQTGPVADELLRRIKLPDSGTRSYSEAEFEQVTLAARQMFRSALRRIDGNGEHLERWRSGGFVAGTEDWEFGETLDVLARTGSLPRYGESGNWNLVKRHRTVLRAKKVGVRWHLLLFPSRLELTALGVLLLAEFGWNLSVIDTLEVPAASPDAGFAGNRIYRVSLRKRRRGSGREFETRNVEDSGAGSPGRVITEALQATRFARALVEDLAPGTNRLLVWRNSAPERPQRDLDRSARVGPFDFGISSSAALEWGHLVGLSGSPFRRGRRTVVALDRREPAQHSSAVHDRSYVLVDPRVQARAADVIAAGVQDAFARAREAFLVAEIRPAPSPGDSPTATADCADSGASPVPTGDGGCGASFLMCLGCSNAHIHPGHHSRLTHLHEALTNLRSVLPAATWAADWGEAHSRLDDLKHKLGEGIWSQAHSRVGADDRELIDHLLRGNLDA